MAVLIAATRDDFLRLGQNQNMCVPTTNLNEVVFQNVKSLNFAREHLAVIRDVLSQLTHCVVTPTVDFVASVRHEIFL